MWNCGLIINFSLHSLSDTDNFLFYLISTFWMKNSITVWQALLRIISDKPKSSKDKVKSLQLFLHSPKSYAKFNLNRVPVSNHPRTMKALWIQWTYIITIGPNRTPILYFPFSWPLIWNFRFITKFNAWVTKCLIKIGIALCICLANELFHS